MSQLVPAQQKTNSLIQQINDPRFLSQLKLALPQAGVTPERLARIAITELRRTPDLALCSPVSIMGAVMQCAQYGLEPGPAGLSWIIPRRNHGKWEANFQLGYKGLAQLLWNSGKVAWINAQVVYKADVFDYSLGTPPHVKYRPCAEGDRGDRTHVWAAIGMVTGGQVVEVWSIARVNEHRARFVVDRKKSPWNTDFDAMAKKTLLVQAAKFAPVSIEVHRAITLDEQSERGIRQELDLGFDLPAFEPQSQEDPEDSGAELEGEEEPTSEQDSIPPLVEDAISKRARMFVNVEAADAAVRKHVSEHFQKDLVKLTGQEVAKAITVAQNCTPDAKVSGGLKEASQ